MAGGDRLPVGPRRCKETCEEQNSGMNYSSSPGTENGWISEAEMTGLGDRLNGIHR